MEAQWPGRLTWWRLLELGLAFVFLMAGLVKIAGLSMMVQFFVDLGFGQWLRYLTGACELAGGVALLTGRLQYLAALGLAVIMVGATDASIVVFDKSPIPPMLTLIALLVVAWQHRPSNVRDTGQ